MPEEPRYIRLAHRGMQCPVCKSHGLSLVSFEAFEGDGQTATHYRYRFDTELGVVAIAMTPEEFKAIPTGRNLLVGMRCANEHEFRLMFVNKSGAMEYSEVIMADDLEKSATDLLADNEPTEWPED